MTLNVHFFNFMFVFITLASSNVHANYFKEYENQMMNEKSRQATDVVLDDLVNAEDLPKEIEIICQEVTNTNRSSYHVILTFIKLPNSYQDPIINIKDIEKDSNVNSDDSGTCMYATSIFLVNHYVLF